MKKSLLITALAALGVSAMAQTPTRTFLYDGDSYGREQFTYLSNEGTWGVPSGASGQVPGVAADGLYANGNGIDGRGNVNRFQVAAKADTEVYVQSYVYVQGSFYAHYTAQGYGVGFEANGVWDTQPVAVLTNRSLYATPSYFTPLVDDPTNPNYQKYGDIDFRLYFTKGSDITQKVGTWTAQWISDNGGAAIQPAQLDLDAVQYNVNNNTYADPNGFYQLVLARHIMNFSGAAQGNHTYKSGGMITISVY
jgi:hypothetical protein